jgi:hypothetical protein
MFLGVDYNRLVQVLARYLKPNKINDLYQFTSELRDTFTYSEGIEIQIGDSVVRNPKATQLSYNTSETITVRVEGANLLPSPIINSGTGAIEYVGKGVLSINGTVVYEGRASTTGNFVFTDDSINGTGLVGDPLSVNGNIYFTNKVVYFEEEFTPNGVSYQLTSNISNATFINGTWNVNNLLTGGTIDVTSLEGKKLTVGGLLGLGATTIVVDSISATGLVTLNAIPSTDLKIRYCYVLQNEDKLEDYKVSDIVSSAEADSDLINSKIAELQEIVTYRLDEQSFDVTNDSLPITTANNTKKLKVDFTNFNSNIDLTGQLPTNMIAGSQVVLRKLETNRHKLIYNDGQIVYDYVNRKGEYLSLEWTGTKYII